MSSLSVIIPTHNTSAMTLACCRAVLATVPASADVVVVDDASEDDSVAQLERLGTGLRVIRRATRGGFAAAANAGAATATGNVLLFLNSDTIVAAGAIDALSGALADNPALGIVGAALVNRDGTPQWSGGPIPTLAWMVASVSGAGAFARRMRGAGTSSRVADVGWVSGAAMAVRKDVFLSAGPFDMEYRFYCQDLALCVRARAAGWRVAVIRDAQVVHLGGATASGDGIAHRPEWLWADLVSWASWHRGEGYGRRVRRALRLAAWTRVATRTVCGKGPWHPATRAYMAGARALAPGTQP